MMGRPITRRAFLGVAASTVAAVLTPAAARIVGPASRPPVSEKFRGPGWYVFRQEGTPWQRAMYAGAPNPWGFIPLSDGPSEEVEVEIHPRSFDRACIWIMEPVPAWRAA